eukprot:4717385-Alexandrium_andersonii.AAC.1
MLAMRVASAAFAGAAQLVVPVDDRRLGARVASAAGIGFAVQPQQARAPICSAFYYSNYSLDYSSDWKGGPTPMTSQTTKTPASAHAP